MNISVVKDFYCKKEDINNKDAEAGGRIGIKNSWAKGDFFDENKIVSSENIGDSYDRNRTEKNDLKNGQGLKKEGHNNGGLSKENIEKLTESVRPENFDKYEEMGIIPDKDNPESILTVSERIEIRLAAYCDDYVPTGSISRADIERMFGNTGMAEQIDNALKKVTELKQISRENSEYLLTNNMDLSIDNIYRAQYSISRTGSVNNNRGVYEKIGDAQWKELKPQIEDILKKNGFDINEKNLENSKWLIEKKIPVTAENIYKLERIDAINENLGEISEGQWLNCIAHSVNYGIAPLDVSAEFYSAISMTSVEAREIVENGTPEQVTELVLDGKNVSLLNMKKLQEERTRSRNDERREEFTEIQKKQIREGHRNLEILKMRMSVESCAILVKNNFNIQLASLSEIVRQIDKMESDYVDAMFAVVTGHKDENIKVSQGVASNEELSGGEMDYKGLFLQVRREMEVMKQVPAYVVGDVVAEKISFQVDEINEAGKNISSRLKNAGEAYEVLGTKPERELGDSLQKAFGNIDEILEGIGEKTSEDNKRAVRILAYNQMEITRENLKLVREADAEVGRLFNNMTPRTTAYLISNGINPLRTNIRKLNDILDDINEEIDTDYEEKYSEYLLKLEKKNGISSEEKEAYIGIYRLLHMIEKGDRRAVGAVLKQGAELNMKNMLTASRSLKRTGKEVKVNDELGMTEDIKLADSNIDNQLKVFESSAFLKRLLDKNSPESMRQLLKDNEETGIEQLITAVENHSEEMEDKDEILNEQKNVYAMRAEEIETLKNIDEAALWEILEDGTLKNTENLLAMSFYSLGRSNVFGRISKGLTDEKVDDDIRKIRESFMEADEEEIGKSIEGLAEDVKDSIFINDKIDVREFRACNRMADYFSNAARKKSYYVPVEINGEEASFKVTLVEQENKKGIVGIKMNFSEGSVAAEFRLNDKELTGFVIDKSGVLSEKEIRLAFEKDGQYELKAFSVNNGDYRGSMYGENRKINEGHTSNRDLFNVAKLFVRVVKNCAEATDK